MGQVANVALTDTFDTWRIRSNQGFTNLFQINPTSNTLSSNTTTTKYFTVSAGGTVSLPAGAITSNTWFANNTITAHALAAGAVTPGRLATGSVAANTNFASSVVTAHALAAGAVTPGRLATGSVAANTNFAAGVISPHALAASSVTSGKIAADAVSSNTIFASSVVTAHALAAGAVTPGRLATDAISANTNFAAGVVTAHALAAGAVTPGRLATGAISANTNFAAGVITNHALAAGAVGYSKIQDVAAASRLLGRGSAGGSGDVEEISLGSGLTMSGTTLSADSAWSYVSTVSLTNQATADFQSMTSGYDYLIAFSDVFNPATSGGEFGVRVEIAGSWLATSYESALGRTTSSGAGGNQGGATTYIQIAYNIGGATDRTFSGEVLIIDPGSTAGYKNILTDAIGREHTNNNYTSRCFGGGMYTAGTGAVTGLRIIHASANLTGTFKLYRRARS